MTDEIITQDELSVLKERADMMGLKYHPNTGVDKLRAKINAALEDTEVEEPVVAAPKQETTAQRRSRLRKEASALVRVRVTCMNPNKREWQGEILTVSNSVVGTYRKYVPFNAEDGYHIPNIILEQLKERKCQVFKTVNGPRGEKMRKGSMIPEFSIDVLPQLTEAELADLAKQQAMSGSITN